ncbi:hypothetical protein [Qipengyuania qiaonensis]|uniref:DUF3618 domain-containing protein n=1 Tax=Qipengyuania qiaonensis TaxID=2867240 RepID=A0ABS7J6S9_9SPHN|nr:hypothetical protein [Qipengyuania qiaonensis]MBX7481348.1 hypothetical protein [Qipengyuania qiaonensis]
MSYRRARMLEDKHLRDSARALVDADIKHLKSDFAHRSFAGRALDRVREGATDLYEEAIDVAEDNKGALAALLAAVAVWFARNPILEMLGFGQEADEKHDDRDEGSERWDP